MTLPKFDSDEFVPAKRPHKSVNRNGFFLAKLVNKSSWTIDH